MVRLVSLLALGLTRFARALELALTRAATAPRGVARGGAPLIFGLAMCALVLGAATGAAAVGDVVRGEVLAVQADSPELVLRTEVGAVLRVRLTGDALVTLNGQTVTPRALRPVNSDSLTEATVTLDALGRAVQVEGRYLVQEGTVLGFSEDGSSIFLATVDEWGRADNREVILAKGVRVKAGAEVVALGLVQPGSQVLVLLDWAGRAKKIELPPRGEKVFSGITRII